MKGCRARHIVGPLKPAHDVNPVLVVIEAAQLRMNLVHQPVECMLSGVPEWRMADVVGEGSSFDEVSIESEAGTNRRGELHHLDAMREPLAKLVVVRSRKQLRLVGEAPQRG